MNGYGNWNVVKLAGNTYLRSFAYIEIISISIYTLFKTETLNNEQCLKLHHQIRTSLF